LTVRCLSSVSRLASVKKCSKEYEGLLLMVLGIVREASFSLRWITWIRGRCDVRARKYLNHLVYVTPCRLVNS
jgi:hypothetical protein